MDEQKTVPINPQVQLRTKDFLVSRAQKTLNAPPFLALALELSHLADTQNALQALVRAGFTPQTLLQKFPNVTAWAICATLLENYGKGTQEIWPLIGRLFGKVPSLPARTEIVDSFKSVCRKIGLVTDGFDRNVDVFLIHVGVARGQLGHVAKAFLQQEAANGLPSSDDVVQLNRWEDDAVLTFLPIRLIRFRRTQRPRRFDVWSGQHTRASHTGGVWVRREQKAGPVNLTANSSKGLRASTRIANGTRVAVQNGRSPAGSNKSVGHSHWLVSQIKIANVRQEAKKRQKGPWIVLISAVKHGQYKLNAAGKVPA